MSDYGYNDNESSSKTRGNWVDDFSKIGETLTGLAGAISPFFGKAPVNTGTVGTGGTDGTGGVGDDYWTGGGGGGGGYTPPPKEPPKTGKIILFSALGLAAVGTAVYFIVRKKQ